MPPPTQTDPEAKPYLRWLGALVILGIMLFFAMAHVGVSVPDLARSLGGSRLSISELQDQVVVSITDKWREEPATRRLQLNKLVLVHRGGNEYTGVASVDDEGRIEEHPIDVTYDGDNLVWQLR